MDEGRAAAAAQYRAFYALNSQQEIERHMAWKAANPERVLQHDEARADRIKAGSDGTLTAPVVRELKAAAVRCAYCDEPFLFAREKQTDHMIAVCHGGEHSRRNVVIVCRRCNGNKASLTYGDWLDRIAPQHRGRAMAPFNQRYGLGAVARPGWPRGLHARPGGRRCNRGARGVGGGRLRRVGQILDPQYSGSFAGGMVAQSL